MTGPVRRSQRPASTGLVATYRTVPPGSGLPPWSAGLAWATSTIEPRGPMPSSAIRRSAR
eukprot:4715279-Alexandrium_andersonii.AAC.1